MRLADSWQHCAGGAGDVNEADSVVGIGVAICGVSVVGVFAAGDSVGVGGAGDGDKAGSIEIAVAIEVAVGGNVSAVVAETRVLQGASDVRGDGLGAVEVEGVL